MTAATPAATARPLGGAIQARIVLPFAIVTLLWGSTWIVIRGQIGIVPISWSVCYRFLVAATAMFGVAIATRCSLRVAARDQALIAIMGLLIFCLNFNGIYRAEHHVTSGVVAAGFSLIVVLNAFLARIFFGQRLSRPFLLGSAAALSGIVLLFVHEIGAVAAHPREAVLGVGLTLAATTAASIANVMQAGPRLGALPTPTVLAWGMAWGAAGDAVLAWITGGPPRIDPSLAYAGGVLYLGLGASALAFPLYFGMIRLIGAARGAYVNVLTPVLAMLLSTVFEGYRWTMLAVAGAALVLFGLAVAMRARSPAR